MKRSRPHGCFSIILKGLVSVYQKFLKTALGKRLSNAPEHVRVFIANTLLDLRKIFFLIITDRSSRWVFIFLVSFYLPVLFYKFFLSPPPINCEILSPRDLILLLEDDNV